MGILVRVTDSSPDDHLRDYGAGALIRLERAATEGGVYAEIDTEPIVAATYSYEIHDPTGDATSWYRSRFSDALGTLFSEYGDPWSLAEPRSYATLDDLLLETASVPTPRESRRVARMEQALVDTKEMIDSELGQDFFRHPVTGDETWLVDAAGGDTLHFHQGLVSVTTLEIRDSLTGSWAAVAADDFLLEPELPRAGEPYFHIKLTGAVSRATWPSGSRLVRITGARGWPRPPRGAVQGNVDWALQELGTNQTAPGTQQGPPELGRPLQPVPYRMPDSVWRLKRSHAERFLGCNL